MRARDFLYVHLKAEDDKYLDNSDQWLSHVCDKFMNDKTNSEHLYRKMESVIGEEQLKRSRILDMGSGCGTFVFYGLMNGYDVYGIDPAAWKHQFNMLKAKENNYPDDWIKRFSNAVGEYLPFVDESFDVISTWQTMDHVQSLEKCFAESKRTLKRGGYLFVHCPNYNLLNTFDANYRIAMPPLMNRYLFKKYLKLRGRPTEGVNRLNFITKRMVFKYLGNDYEILDFSFSSLSRTKARICDKIQINSERLARSYLVFKRITENAFRLEESVDIAARKK